MGHGSRQILIQAAQDRADWSAVVRLSKEWLEQDPAQTWPKLAMAFAYGRLDRPQEGMVVVRGVLSADAEDVAALRCLAFLQMRAQELDAAEHTFQQARALAPQNVLVLDVGAYIALNRKDGPALAERLQAYRRIVGDTPATMLLDAYRARLEGDPQEARAILMRLLVQAPEHVRAHTQIAQLDLDAGHLQSARDHALTAARLNPNDPAARNLARALRRLHHPVLRAWFSLCLAVWQPGGRYLRIGVWAVFAIIGFVSVEAMVVCVVTYMILRFAGRSRWNGCKRR